MCKKWIDQRFEKLTIIKPFNANPKHLQLNLDPSYTLYATVQEGDSGPDNT